MHGIIRVRQKPRIIVAPTCLPNVGQRARAHIMPPSPPLPPSIPAPTLKRSLTYRPFSCLAFPPKVRSRASPICEN